MILDSAPAFQKNPGAIAHAIQQAATALACNLPDDYCQFLSLCNGGEGVVGEHWVMLWCCEELAKLNQGYKMAEHAADLILFGSDGGGNAFAFDRRTNPWSVVTIPFIGFDLEYAATLGDSFSDFLKRLSNSENDDPPGRAVQRMKGLEIFEITPVRLGGDPIDPSNKALLTRQQHIDAVCFWNATIRRLRRGGR
jgi:hypothetical protein